MRPTDPHRPLPVITAGTPVLTRGDGSLHIGCEPASALILRLAPPAVPRAVAQLLDELRTPQTRAALAGRLRAAGLSAAGFTALLDRLVAAGKAIEPVRTASSTLRIRVHGHNLLARQLADELTAAGVPVATGAPGAAALASPRPLDCNLLLLTDQMIIDPAVRLALMAAGTPHLPVRVHDGIGTIGPLVLPGHSSCLRCADLHRCELDPEWPVLAARLARMPGAADPGTVALTAAIAGQEILGITARLATGGAAPQTLDHQLQVHTRPAGTTLLSAPPHPRCGCGASGRPR
ncbi:MAG: hypothetical protein WAW85_02715 [Gordonia sp. (in: high G+C Gram-positive bacteria)]|uniref:hypothetical protein n=1 Tax=Gordonia sp. (in: high G+C Gram-positive bacteria) TaxID=84139 RepID=UPI003BB7070F